MLKYSDFIYEHRNDDVRDLALRQSRYPDVDIPYAVRQIAAWQTACRKLPLWSSTEGIEFPVHLSMEQCSSQLTAEYKATLPFPLPTFPYGEDSRQDGSRGESMTDLTAGFGVDAVMLGRMFGHLNYVERDEALCEIARGNLPLLGIKDFSVLNADAMEVLQTLPHQALIFLDPARRDEHGGKTVQINDCTPDITLMQDMLLERADMVMVKLSPMLNISSILYELKCVAEVHIVSVDNECKELLVVMRKDSTTPVRITGVNLKSNGERQSFSFLHSEEREAECHYTSTITEGCYLYEPNVSMMKAGCFKLLAQTYGITKLHPSSHLYTSSEFLPDFPGRSFRIKCVCGMKDKQLRQVKKANLTVRNFPMTVAELRKKLKISEGGNEYLFATTLADETKVVIWTVR